MIVNQSILPFYISREHQHTRFRSYAQGKNYGPTIAKAGFLPTFQILRLTNLSTAVTFTLRNVNTSTQEDITSDVNNSGFYIDDTYDYEVLIYSATQPISVTDHGSYELEVSDGVNTWYSEIFAMADVSRMIKLSYWHLQDLTFDQNPETGQNYRIRYRAPFVNVLYIEDELFRPNYPYYREVERRLGRNFDKLHISAKEYGCRLFCTEDLLDAVRLIPLHDRKRVQFRGKTYEIDELLIDPTWLPHFDIAEVGITFRTNTVAIVAGRSATGAYEVEGGACVMTRYNCVGLVDTSSPEYSAFQYIDANGVTQDLQNGENILASNAGVLNVEEYNASTYTPRATAAGEVVYVASTNKYYTGNGSSVALPIIQFYDRASEQVAGTFLPGANHTLYAIVNGSPEVIDVYTYDDLAINGVAVPIPAGTSAIRMELSSGACGIFQTPDDYILPDANEGIGFDAIGSSDIG